MQETVPPQAVLGEAPAAVPAEQLALAPVGGGEADKVSMILAVVSFLIVVGMVVVLAMMKVK